MKFEIHTCQQCDAITGRADGQWLVCGARNGLHVLPDSMECDLFELAKGDSVSTEKESSPCQIG